MGSQPQSKSDALCSREWVQPLFLDAEALASIRTAVEGINPNQSLKINSTQSNNYTTSVDGKELLGHSKTPSQRIEAIEFIIDLSGPDAPGQGSHATAELRIFRQATGKEDSNVEVELFGPRTHVDRTRTELEKALEAAIPSYAPLAHPWAERLRTLLVFAAFICPLGGWETNHVQLLTLGGLATALACAFVGPGRELLFPWTRFHVGRGVHDEKSASTLRSVVLLGGVLGSGVTALLVN